MAAITARRPSNFVLRTFHYPKDSPSPTSMVSAIEGERAIGLAQNAIDLAASGKARVSYIVVLRMTPGPNPD